MNSILEQLTASEEPAIRYKARVHVMEEDPAAPAIRRLQQEIKDCERVRQLLSLREADGKIPRHPYSKWYGAHWVLAMLADLNYPVGDADLIPLREQVYGWLLSEGRRQTAKRHTFAGHTRMCASMEGNAIFALLKLGLSDERTDHLVEHLLTWQWPDGGWNCDKHPQAHVSSFTETILPLRGLALYSQVKGSTQAREASRRAAEIFLQRHLFKRLSDGQTISEKFLKLHYPCYWHYDILFGLKVMAEAGFLQDERCREALNLLAARRLPDGGFPAEQKYYRTTGPIENNRSLVDWGGTSTKQMNPFVTVEALAVLKQAGLESA
ncbi:MAG TPA: hypothetical protein VH540_26905 [Ktedonobacterales bacterium]|jgi:hypothetical protein